MNKSFKKYIRSACSELRRHFFHGEYVMDIAWGTEKPKDLAENCQVAASIDADFKYLRFTVNIGDCLFDDYKDKKYYRILETLVHEFCHLLIDPVYQIACDAISNQTGKHLEEVRERQIQRATNIIILGIPKSFYIPKKKKKNTKKTKRQ